MHDDTPAELVDATHRALCKHGYASLRMQDIADESSKSKAALHYHFDSKHDLLIAFLDYLYDRFEAKLDEEAGDDPATRLTTFVERRLTPDDEATRQEFQTAILEIKAQAPYDDAYRDRLARFDQLMHDRLRSILEAGIDQGAFESDLDPGETAAFLVTHINGAHTRHVAVGYPIAETRRMLLNHVARRVIADAETVEAVE